MRCLSAFLLLMACLSCATVQEESPAEKPAEESKPARKATAAETKPEPAAKEEQKETLVEQTVYLLSEERFLFADGSAYKINKLMYEEEGTRLLRSELRMAAGDLIEFGISEYGGELLRKRAMYDEKEKLKSYHAFEYTDAGLLAADTLFDSGDKVQTSSAFEYDMHGRRVKWSIFDSGGALLGYSGYSYDGGRKRRVDICDLTGRLEEYGEIEYDDQGRVKTERFFSAAKKPLHSIEYEYTEQGLAVESRFADRNKLQRRFVYEYDENGNVNKIVQYGRNGTVKSIRERDYIQRTIMVRK